VLVVVLAVAGTAFVVLRRAWAPLAYLTTSLAGAALFVAIGSPWLDGKALATASPAVLFAALIGCASIRGRLGTLLAVAAASTVVLGVLWSNALAYHGVSLAPHGQLSELEQIGQRFAGQGPTLMTEYQPYGVRHFLRRLDPEGASELRRRLVRKVDGSLPQKGEAPDLDELALSSVLVYRTLVLRRSPVSSRPPTPYTLRWRGRWYEVWQRPLLGTAVAAHLPLGGADSPGAVPPCVDVRRIARGARAIAAVPRAGPIAVLPAGPSGAEEAFVVPETGRYALWLAGSRRASADVSIDGRRVAIAPAHFDHATEYSELALVNLGPGVHTVQVRFEQQWLEPGTGGPEYGFGPLVVAFANQQRNVITVEPQRAASLCGRTLDWVEALR
jgi:hypothetical protein